MRTKRSTLKIGEVRFRNLERLEPLIQHDSDSARLGPLICTKGEPVTREETTMQVAEVMTKQVKCCAADDSLEHAAQLMWDNDCGCLPVSSIRDGASQTVGLITDRDICMCALFERRPLSELRVGQAMARRVLSCSPADSLEQAERVMQDARVRRLPVLSAKGDLLGIVSLADLAREAARESSGRTIKRDISQSDIGSTLAAICARAGRVAAA